MAELADALASGASDSNIVQVQPLSRVPKNRLLPSLSFCEMYDFNLPPELSQDVLHPVVSGPPQTASSS